MSALLWSQLLCKFSIDVQGKTINIGWFQLFEFKDLMFFFVIYGSNWRDFGFQTVGWIK